MGKRFRGSTNIFRNSIYLDAEWYIGGNVFLIGYVYQNGDKDQLFDRSLTKKNFLHALSSVNVIYFYGPDIGVIESHFDTKRKERLLRYNLEDVVNLKKLWSIIKREKNITNDYLIQNRLL